MAAMTWGQGLVGFAFVFTGGLVVLAWHLAGRDRRLDARLRELSGKEAGPNSPADLVRAALPQVGRPLLPESERERSRLQNRLTRAGFHGPNVLYVYLGVKAVLIFTPWLVGLTAGCVRLAPMHVALAAGALAGLGGLVGPPLWLRRQVARRQAALVQREIELGSSAGEALGRLAARSGLDEIRSLAGVVRQTEKLGGGLARSLRVHSEALRQRQTQRAEEQAHKAATKVLMPTLLLIFPGIFIIILGPAALQVIDLVGRIRPEARSFPAVERPLKAR